MRYFENLLINRNISKADINFLWELHLTDKEYSDLKGILWEDAQDNRFSDTKAAALYYAEWWRREFCGGHVGTDDPCRTLLEDDTLKDQLYQAAQRGATELGVQIITTRGEQREVRNIMYSLFYQGGLPMNYIVQEILSNGNNGWNTFIRQLVWNQQDFNQVNGLGEIASRSDSMQGFCAKLRTAADNQDPSIQPYYHKDLWWNVVVRQFEESKRERRARTPFEVSWVFRFDNRVKRITAGARISGQSTLSEEFIRENNLTGREFTTISVLVNDKNIYTAEYDQKFYCRKSIEIKFQYNIGDTITISLNEGERILSKKALDFDSPKLLFCKDDDETRFYLGEPHHLKDHRCRIVASNDWREDCDRLGGCISYGIGGQNVNVFNIIDTNNIIILRNICDGEIKKIDPAQSFHKTFIDYRCAIALSIPAKEHVFNAHRHLRFYEGDENDARSVGLNDVYFSPKGERNWSSTSPLGEIKARVKLADNEYSEPVHFINSGDLEINVIKSSHDSCNIQINWGFGSIESDHAERRGENWTITRDNLISNRYCVFTFKPQNRLGTEFKLTLTPPFHDFCIFDQNDNKIAHRSIIPLVDLNNYRYYINSNQRYRLVFDRDQGHCFDYINGPNSQGAKVSEVLVEQIIAERQIAHEGPLGSLFLEGSEQIEHRINNACLSLPYIKTDINITDSEDRQCSYSVKPFPLRLVRQDKAVTITNANTSTLSYSGSIFALPFDEPGLTPVELIKDTDNIYILPTEMYKSTYNHWLVYGDRQGYILPISVKTANTDIQEQSENVGTSSNENGATRADKLSEIKNRLLNEPMFSESWEKAIKWYKMLPQGCIPGTSVLELVAIADEWTLPIKLALHLWVEALCSTSSVKESINYLESSLIDFSKQMSFLWKWCRIPSEEEINSFARELFDEGRINLDKCYFGWTLTQPIDLFQANPQRINPDRTVLFKAFIEWIGIIRTESQPIQILTDPDINNHGDGLTSNEARDYFNHMIMTNPGIARLPLNDKWISVRHNCDQMFQAIDFGIMPGNEHVRREIRQSIINGLKYWTRAQIEAANRQQRGRRRRRN